MTMSLDPGIVDTNVLVYALDGDAPQHAAARAVLDAAREASATLYVTPQILCEFYSTVTNARRVPKPSSPADAIAVIADLLTVLHVLPIPAHMIEGLLDLLRRRPVTGADVFDLQIIATMQASGLRTIYTFNVADFAAFPELSVVTPAAAP
jgi:predicted nucleic acid-binding protein